MKKNIKIAIFSPSSPLKNPEKLRSGLEIARQNLPTAQFIPEEPLSNSNLPYLASTDTSQAEAFSKLLENKDLDYIWFVRGGYGSIRWLGQVKWPKGPLPVPIGFSDPTSILNIIVSKGGKAIHGPMLSTLKNTQPYCRDLLFKILSGSSMIGQKWQGQPLLEGIAKGPLIGGNLATILSTLGTPLEPPWEGGLLFLEDYHEPLYKLDRMFTQLLLSDRLNKVSGIVLGQFLSLGKEEKFLKPLLLDRLKNLGIPIIWKVPSGHGPLNEPLILGAEHHLDGKKGELTLVNH